MHRRIEPFRHREFVVRLLELPLNSQHGTKVEMSRGVVAIQPDGLAKRGDRLVQLALILQGVAEVGVVLALVRLEPDGCTESGDGLVDLSFLQQRVAEVIVKFWAPFGSSRMASR